MKKLIMGALAALATLAASPALATNCGALPFTLTNGTTADATQVMSNFNLLLNCSNLNLAHNGVNVDITSLSGVILTGTTTHTGPVLFNTDNTYDIGATGATRPRNLFLAGTATIGGDITGSGNLTSSAGGAHVWSGRSILTSPADGKITLLNNAQTGFTALQFGGTSASFPSLKRSATALAVRLADDSADAPITASSGTFSGAVSGTTGTFTGEVSTPASTTGAASLNVPHGAAPTSPVNGDIWTTTAGLFVRANGVTQGPFFSANQVIEVQNKQTQGTANPESSAGWASATWNHRVFNTTLTNNISGASLGSNQVTLPAGTYTFVMTGTQFIGANQSGVFRVFDYTASAFLTTMNMASPDGSRPVAMAGTFTLAASHAVGFDWYSPSTAPTNQGTINNITGVSEVYTDLIIQKIG